MRHLSQTVTYCDGKMVKLKGGKKTMNTRLP